MRRRKTMIRVLTVDPLNQLAHPFNQTLDTGLVGNVVILYPVEQLGETPERVCLYCGESRGGEVTDVEELRVGVF
jgi:hypothetical protein